MGLRRAIPGIFAAGQIAVCAGLLFAPPVIGQDAAPQFPRIDGDIIYRLAFDDLYSAEDGRVSAQDLAVKIEARPAFQFTERFRLGTEIRLENEGPPTADRYFEEQALFVRKSFLEYDLTENLSILGGKFTPSFAFFSLEIPGMYGNSFSKEIELIERVGFAADYRFDLGIPGFHMLSAAAFFDDTSILSDSLINSRGQKRLEDGGASNTESLESFSLAFEGRDVGPRQGFTYKFALLHEAAGQGDVSDENGVLIAAKQSLDFANGANLGIFGEAAALENFEGSADDVNFLSLGLSYLSGPWRTTVSGTYRPRDLATGGTVQDYSLQIAVSYSLRDDLAIEVAHEFSRDQGLRGDQIGFRLNKLVDLN
ncbi:MAG: hypothetical protein AAF667_01610 [Pseudomonadota bacterium]